jgi:hypothetical protein
MGAAIIADVDAAPVLESAEHVLDLVPAAVERGVVRDWCLPARLDRRGGARRPTRPRSCRRSSYRGSARGGSAVPHRKCGRYGQPGLLVGLADPLLARALRLIHGDVAHAWSVEELAREAGLSRSAFSERFSQKVGVPLMQYLLG